VLEFTVNYVVITCLLWRWTTWPFSVWRSAFDGERKIRSLKFLLKLSFIVMKTLCVDWKLYYLLEWRVISNVQSRAKELSREESAII
jgi:hypothetical protein